MLLRTGSSHGRCPRTPAAVKAPTGSATRRASHWVPASDCSGTPGAMASLEPDAQPPAGRALTAFTSLPIALSQLAANAEAPTLSRPRSLPPIGEWPPRDTNHPLCERPLPLTVFARSCVPRFLQLPAWAPQSMPQLTGDGQSRYLYPQCRD
jgi:hypothetical protein